MEMKSLQQEQQQQPLTLVTSPDPGRCQSDPFRCISTSNDACDAIRVMQEEAAAARLAQNEGKQTAKISLFFKM